MEVSPLLVPRGANQNDHLLIEKCFSVLLPSELDWFNGGSPLSARFPACGAPPQGFHYPSPFIYSPLATLKKPPSIAHPSLGLVRPRPQPHLVHRNGPPTRKPPTLLCGWLVFERNCLSRIRIRAFIGRHGCLRILNSPSPPSHMHAVIFLVSRLPCNSLLLCLVVSAATTILLILLLLHPHRTATARTQTCHESHLSIDESSQWVSPIPVRVQFPYASLADP